MSAAAMASVSVQPLATVFSVSALMRPFTREGSAAVAYSHILRIIAFDEAVSALDVSVQVQVLNLIRDLQAEHGFGALFILHDLPVTRYLCHRIAVMREGEIVEIGPSERFYGRPEHECSRALLAAAL